MQSDAPRTQQCSKPWNKQFIRCRALYAGNVKRPKPHLCVMFQKSFLWALSYLTRKHKPHCSKLLYNRATSFSTRQFSILTAFSWGSLRWCVQQCIRTATLTHPFFYSFGASHHTQWCLTSLNGPRRENKNFISSHGRGIYRGVDEPKKQNCGKRARRWSTDHHLPLRMRPLLPHSTSFSILSS